MNNLEIQGITKEMQHEKVLDKVSLCASGGKIYGIVGKNGSGKSMLFRAISGLINVDEGSILWNGKECTRDLSQKIRLGIIVENVNLYADLSGMDNLKYLAKINNYIGEKEIIETLEKIGLDSKNKKKVKTYSLGMRQKLVIAQAIMENPDLLLLDEPTNALDAETVKKFREILKEHKNRGAIILIASHNREDIEELCDEVYVMNDGVLSK
jgi:ABC-2 type transport system ATP-binding protein